MMPPLPHGRWHGQPPPPLPDWRHIERRSGRLPPELPPPLVRVAAPPLPPVYGRPPPEMDALRRLAYLLGP
jgi:hypothetical protein